ncbi:hypothetical protein B296_00035347 [Ensete ventricosum]|uniref:Uncharacterized protein n=1 Tax=Ensete ventricosum TaxID=4639 RepID=A0A426Z2H6_ENSVE|nr:hypothetical protein B296_00035347 [Ensete ventricosum]
MVYSERVMMAARINRNCFFSESNLAGRGAEEEAIATSKHEERWRPGRIRVLWVSPARWLDSYLKAVGICTCCGFSLRNPDTSLKLPLFIMCG